MDRLKGPKRNVTPEERSFTSSQRAGMSLYNRRIKARNVGRRPLFFGGDAGLDPKETGRRSRILLGGG